MGPYHKAFWNEDLGIKILLKGFYMWPWANTNPFLTASFSFPG